MARQRVLVEQAEQFAALARATLEADDASHPAIVDAEARPTGSPAPPARRQEKIVNLTE